MCFQAKPNEPRTNLGDSHESLLPGPSNIQPAPMLHSCFSSIFFLFSVYFFLCLLFDELKTQMKLLKQLLS